MKTRTKILITVGLAIAYFWLTQKFAPTPAQPALSAKQLQSWYSAYNETYFDNSLPKNVVIDYDQHDDQYMATTMKWQNGTFHINFNRNYTGGERVALYTLLHESCHIKTWDSYNVFDGEHNKSWQDCMLRLDSHGAFRKILIDNYEGN